MAMLTSRPSAGELLRGWRTRRRRSQLDLSLEVGVSTRHLSFVETGKSRASRELLLDLARHLEVPLRERNALLLAAGYAPSYAESRLDDRDLDAVRDALAHLLAGHEPYPALVVDRLGDVVMTNRPVTALLAAVDPALLTPPVNIYRLSVDPRGLAPHIRNLGEWSAHLLHRLERLAALTGDPRLAALHRETAGHVHALGVRLPREDDPSHQVMLPLQITSPHGELRLWSTITHFGATHDVTLDELSIETFVPADAATREVLTRLADPGRVL